MQVALKIIACAIEISVLYKNIVIPYIKGKSQWKMFNLTQKWEDGISC